MTERIDGGRCCPVVELRQYTLAPGRREDLIEVFDRHLVEPQEALGMTVIGQFRDRRRPDRFVWLRGFADMERRRQALESFYGGPVWAKHGPAANDTMLEWDDVLLLRPARPDMALALAGSGPAGRPRDVVVGIHASPRQSGTDRDSEFLAWFEHEVAPRLTARGVRIEGVFVTETAANTFARLPVREGESVLVWLGTVDEPTRTVGWLDDAVGASQPGAPGIDRGEQSVLYLEPTSRSVLGGGSLAARSSKHDFDFLFGTWRVHNRYLKGRLRGSADWMEFEGRCEAMPLLQGLANLDRYTAEREGTPFEGMTLRLFDPTTGQWTLHWADSAHPGHLIPPMEGRFAGGVGEFFGKESVDGKEVLCRFLWTPDPPRWEQAFSDDGGRTWETNWIMTFRRA